MIGNDGFTFGGDMDASLVTAQDFNAAAAVGIDNSQNAVQSYQQFQTQLISSQNQMLQQSQIDAYSQKQAAAYLAGNQSNFAYAQEQQAALGLKNITNLEIQALNNTNQFNQYFTQSNINVLTQNMYALNTAANTDLSKANLQASSRMGQVRAGYTSGAGVVVGTGTAANVENQARDQTLKQADEDYAQKANQISSAAAQIVNTSINQYLSNYNVTQQTNILNQQLTNQLNSMPNIAPAPVSQAFGTQIAPGTVI